MKHRKHSRRNAALLVGAALSLVAAPAFAAGGGKSLGKDSGVIPAVVEHIPGSSLSRVTLTERAAQRIDLQTATVTEEMLNGVSRKVVPYSSLIYDPHGGTWVYTSTKARTFVRAPIDIDFIEGDRIVLKDGPPVGTTVATLGVAEIYGEEFHVGH